LTVASYIGGKSPLVVPMDSKDDAINSHEKFKVRQSDMLTVCSAFEAWQTCGSRSSQWKFCEEVIFFDLEFFGHDYS
jgi:hypothetical protein